MKKFIPMTLLFASLTLTSCAHFGGCCKKKCSGEKKQCKLKDGDCHKKRSHSKDKG